MPGLHVGELARRLHTTPRAIRWYERTGLLSPGREQNEYRTYSEEDTWRLQTIIALRALGMPLSRIRRVLEDIDRGARDKVFEYLEWQRASLYAKWSDLTQVIERTEAVADAYGLQGVLRPQDLADLAADLGRLRDARDSWQDLWFFDQRATAFDAAVQAADDPLDVYHGYDAVLDRLTEELSPEPGEHGLELGVGTGNLSGRLLRRGCRMSGVEQSSSMLRRCREKFPQIEAKLGNVLAAPFFSGRFDFVASSYMLHHLTADQTVLALREMDRLVKPQGRIGLADVMTSGSEDPRPPVGGPDEDMRPGPRDVEEQRLPKRGMLVRWFSDHGYATRTIAVSGWTEIVIAKRREDAASSA